MTATSKPPGPRLRAVGIVRVSRVGGREAEKFHSPATQRKAIEKLCADNGWHLIAVHEELDVSGNHLLEDRPGLSQAVTAVLSGNAEIVVGAYTERLWWNHEVRSQVLRLIEAAGGTVWSADEGRLSNGSAADEFTGSVRTSADRFSRRQNAEKSRAAVTRAVARGVVPWSGAIPGYLRADDGMLEPDPELAPVIAEAFAMRARGTTIMALRAYLREHGVERSFHGVAQLLGSRVVLGEIHFGDLKNLSAHPAIVDPDTWKAVQKTRVSRGRRPKSARLLARLDILRCATCDSRMVVGTQTQGGRCYHFYRCPPNADCPRRVTVGAEMVEALVAAETRRLLADVEGRASAAAQARRTVESRDAAQAEFDKGIRNLSGLEDEPAARERLAELRAERDAWQDKVDRLPSGTATLTINACKDWDDLSLDEKRGLIRSAIGRVTVAPGRGLGRVTIEPLS